MFERMGGFRHVYKLGGGNDDVRIELLSRRDCHEELEDEEIQFLTLEPNQGDSFGIVQSIDLVNFTGSLFIIRNNQKAGTEKISSPALRAARRERLKRTNTEKIGNEIQSIVDARVISDSYRYPTAPAQASEKLLMEGNKEPELQQKSNSKQDSRDKIKVKIEGEIEGKREDKSSVRPSKLEGILKTSRKNDNNAVVANSPSGSKSKWAVVAESTKSGKLTSSNPADNEGKTISLPKEETNEIPKDSQRSSSLSREWSFLLKMTDIKSHVPQEVRNRRANNMQVQYDNPTTISEEEGDEIPSTCDDDGNNGAGNDISNLRAQDSVNATLADANSLYKSAKSYIAKKISMNGKDESPRSEDDGSRSLSSNQPKPLRFPTKLHALCAETDVTLSELDKALTDCGLDSLSIPDSAGRLPLHILGDNDLLISNPGGKLIASTFAVRMMKAYPPAITTLDDRKRMPFVTLVEDWCNWTFQKKKEKSQKHNQRKNTKFGLAKKIIENITNTAEQVHERTRKVIHENGPGSSYGYNSASAQANTFVTDDLQSLSTKLFPKVELWNEVEWCFLMLSVAMDVLGNGKTDVEHPERTMMVQKNHRTKLANHLLLVFPNIIKIILLIEEEGEETRHRLFRLSIFRRILLCPESVGPWLGLMLQRKGIPSKRAIDYLSMASKSSVSDYAGDRRTLIDHDYEEFYEMKVAVFDAIDRQGGTITSLVVLDREDVRRASNLSVVWYIMSKHLNRPFLVGIVLMDFALHVTLMLAFRFQSLSDENGGVPEGVSLLICCHYIIRKFCEGLSLLTISVEVFKSYFSSFWTIFDVITIILTSMAVIRNLNADEISGGLNACITGLLWLKVLGFLKVVNKEMATFVMSLFEILKDLKLFFVVLMVFIFMFGDMLNIAVSSKDDGQFCIDNVVDADDPPGPLESFCSSSRSQSYLRVYSLLIGDFELDDYLEPDSLLFFFVIFTLLGVIILLNVLIALVSESYEKATMTSGTLFAIARVSFVAQHEALEKFLRPGESPFINAQMFASRERVFNLLSRIVRWLVLITLILTATSAEYFLVERSIIAVRHKDDFISLIMVAALCFMLTSAIWIISIFAFETAVLNYTSGYCSNVFFLSKSCTDKLVCWASRLMFGSSYDLRLAKNNTDTEDDWTGRIKYIEKSIEKSQKRMRKDFEEELTALENRLYEHEVFKANTAIAE